MRKLKNMSILRYIAFILLPGVIFSLPACKKKEPPQARQGTQNTLINSEYEQITVGDKIPLKILYVGLVNTERHKDFVSFLSDNFTQVKSTDLYAFKEEQTKGSDVVILDKDGIQWAGRGDGKPLMNYPVSNQYSRPTITLGIPGAFWTDRMRLKTGYM
jgi:hypothetical protein